VRRYEIVPRVGHVRSVVKEVVIGRSPIAVAARSKAWVCGRSLTRIVGSNPPGAWMSVSCECCVLSGRGLYVGPISGPEESYRVWCVCVIVKPRYWGGPGPVRAVAPLGNNFFCGEGPRSRCYGRTAALRLIVQTCDEDEKVISFFLIFPSNRAPVERNWQGTTEVLGGRKPVPVPLCPPQIPHGLTRDRKKIS
jgi:hypothetical protein